MKKHSNSMLKALLAVAVATGSSCSQMAKAENAYSLILHGASYHSNQGKRWEENGVHYVKRYNQQNYGVGLEMERSSILYRAGTYKDSYFQQAFYATIGYRKMFAGSKEGWHIGSSVNAGLLYGSGNHGLAATPQLEIGHGKITTEIIFIPKVSKDTCNAVAASVKISF